MSHAKLEVRMESLLPFLQGTCTPYNMPVYPGAQCQIANALIENFGKGTLRVPARHPLLVSYWLLNLPARPRRG
jgi:hypothetical protein